MQLSHRNCYPTNNNVVFSTLASENIRLLQQPLVFRNCLLVIQAVLSLNTYSSSPLAASMPPCISQAAMLSLLDPQLADAAITASAREDTSDVAWIADLVHWLRSSFNLMASDSQIEGAARASGGREGASGSSNGAVAAAAAAALGAAAAKGHRRGRGAGGEVSERVMQLLRRGEELGEQLRHCVEGRRGTAEQLNALLVALLRALGLLVRTTW